MKGKVITACSYAGLEELLLGEYGKIRKSAPLARIDILVGSNMLGGYLRNRMAAATGGIFNTRFITFDGLISHIESLSQEYGKGPLPPFAGQVITGEIASASGITGDPDPPAPSRGTVDALYSTFTDLAEGCLACERAEELAGGRAVSGLAESTRKALSLYSEFRRRIESCGGDIHSRYHGASSAHIGRLFESALLVYGFYDLNGEQWKLLSSLGNGDEIIFFIPFGESPEYAFSGRLLGRCEEKGLERVSHPEAAAPVRRISLFSAHDDEAETREVARRVLSAAAGDEARFDQIAVVIPSDTCRDLVREVFEEAGIPFYESTSSPRGPGPAARGASRLMRLLDDEVERGDLVEFLVSAPLRQPEEASHRYDPFSIWVRESAESGMTGRSGWLEENEALAARVHSAMERGEMEDAVKGAVEHVGEVIARIIRGREEIEGESTWSGRSSLFSALIGDLFERSGETEGLRRSVEELGGLDLTSPGPEEWNFRSTLERMLAAHGAERSNWTRGKVSVLTPHEARGMRFEAVFMTGMAEEIVPTAAPQDPFLRDCDRSLIEDASGEGILLSRKGERARETALLTRLVSDSCRSLLVCSYPRNEQGTGRERMPSSVFRHIRGFDQCGEPGPSVKVERISNRMDVFDEEIPLSTGEYGLLVASSEPAAAAPALYGRFFSRGVRMSRARFGKGRFTPYDAVFDSKEAVAELGGILNERSWSFSATSLERWAKCPFSYFMQNVLGVDEVEEPERIVTIDPMQRGILVHRILERVYSSLSGEGLLPVSETTLDRADLVASGICGKILDDFPREEPVGLPVFWEMEKERISEAVGILLREEAAGGGGYVPYAFEVPFGKGTSTGTVEYALAGKTVRLHGRIDRIDRGDGGKYRVIDYKTGKLAGKDDDMAGGAALQLPVYLVAASKITGSEEAKGTAFYRKVGTGPGRRSVGFSGAGWSGMREEFASILSVIVEGIEKGIFFAPSGQAACRYCGVRTACPSSRERIFEMKASGDARCKEYLSMRNMEVTGA